jgi:hypothetical protein
MAQRFRWITVGVIVGVMAASGIGYAAVHLGSPIDGSGVIHGCYGAKTGAVVLRVGATCPSGDTTPISWNQRGLMGAQGSPGATGAPGISHAYSATNSFAALPRYVETNVVQLSLPAGRYALSAKLEIDKITATAASAITCHLYVNYVDTFVNSIDQDTAQFFIDKQYEHADVWTLQGTVYYTQPGYAIVACESQQGQTDNSTTDTASNAVLMANAVGSIG